MKFLYIKILNVLTDGAKTCYLDDVECILKLESKLHKPINTIKSDLKTI